MRNMETTVHSLDNERLLHEFRDASERSMDDEFIQILLREIKERRLTIEEVIREIGLH
ncbi:sporulation histidine kinase inhibitor Sda [Cohnella fermenti]|uniref:Sporulation histidine kinase inhibitor Sda n=1 Tax=Cohnella fermenti TaxID=2565925 RepID=A0A4S4C8U2_9BACL|nr:sporulation histidine kinase inhibitor Sda [Cohnella fermenti]THF83770.1 sporulation histidine kinase inhibitor Sda [Cohnella fermenti]